jgi:hypothetical protein
MAALPKQSLQSKGPCCLLQFLQTQKQQNQPITDPSILTSKTNKPPPKKTPIHQQLKTCTFLLYIRERYFM